MAKDESADLGYSGTGVMSDSGVFQEATAGELHAHLMMCDVPEEPRNSLKHLLADEAVSPI